MYGWSVVSDPLFRKEWYPQKPLAPPQPGTVIWFETMTRGRFEKPGGMKPWVTCHCATLPV
jgi:hypothetical protein